MSTAFIVIAFFASTRVHAIVINDGVGPAGAQALGEVLKSVGSLKAGGGLCTGTLIGPRVFLTAKHCTGFVSPALMTVEFGVDSGNPELTVGVAAKFEAGGGPSVELLDGTDVSVLILDQDIPSSVAVPAFISASTPTGVGGLIFGYGFNGIGSIGHQNTSDGLRWAALNTIDVYGSAAGQFGLMPGTSNIFSTDFDDGSAGKNALGSLGSSATPLTIEGTTAPGDSGGPLIYFADGVPKVIGVLSGGTSATSQYGDISWWTGLGGVFGGQTVAGNGTDMTTELVERIASSSAATTASMTTSGHARHLTSAASVPEPATLNLLVLAMTVGLLRIRR